MPRKKYHVTLTAEERTQLEQLLRGGKAGVTPFFRLSRLSVVRQPGARAA